VEVGSLMRSRTATTQTMSAIMCLPQRREGTTVYARFLMLILVSTRLEREFRSALMNRVELIPSLFVTNPRYTSAMGNQDCDCEVDHTTRSYSLLSRLWTPA